MARAGRPIAGAKCFFRTAVPLIPVYGILVAEYYLPLGNDIIDTGLTYNIVIAGAGLVFSIAIISVLSFALVRELHPHGQGILDLIFRTVTVPVI